MSVCLAAVLTLAAASASAAPEFKVGSVENPTAIHIQRTMKALEESTAEKPATVRVLFYGQSIVAQGWTKVLMDMLKEKYPTVNFVWANKAIGGFTSPALTRTAWSDLFPYYPDLLFFHVYGPIDKYEEIVKNTRAMTSAEIVLWSSHLSAGQDPKKMLAERDKRSKDIMAVAARNKCMFVDLNKKWSEMLVANGWAAANLLSDGIHMSNKTDAFKYYAGFIGEELRRIPGAAGEPDVSGTITEVPAANGTDVKVAGDGSLRLSFTGNRVVAVSNGQNFNPAAAQPCEAELFLDGKPVASYKEMWYCTRPSTLVSWMPMIYRVTFDTLPVKEDWTLTYLDGTDPWGKPVHYKVEGNVTGFDGEGWSTNAFTSTSGRAVIAKDAYHFTWQYDYFVKKHVDKKPELMKKAAKPGDKITWKTLPLFADPFVAQKAGERSVLVQNCPNGRHVLEIRPKNGGKFPGIEKFIIYSPAPAGAAAAPIELHVSPAGNDSNPGTREKPLATPAGARDALRRMRAANGGCGTRVLPAEVAFEDGVYLLSEPVRLDARDGSNVTWRAANRGEAVFSGALTPAGWKKVDDPSILNLLPEAARGHVIMADIPQGLDLPGFRGGGCGTPARLQEIPLSLFQGERRLESARWPNEGFVRTGDNVGKMEKRHDATYSTSGVFKFASPRLAQWAKEPELWAYGLWCYEWADAKARVLAIDPSAGTISVDPSPIGFGIRENAQFYVLNAISEIDRPGEWAIDRAARRVYLWPVGSDPICFAAASGLVDAQDVSDVTFDGFVFEHSRTTAVRFNNSVRAKVLSSVFRHTSSWGVKVARGTDCHVEGCDMYDLGEGGVSLEGGDFKTLAPGNNVADNNHIHHYGRVVPNYRPGVQLDGVGNRCTHNLIHHTLHQAVAFGGNDHYIGFNVCHDCCMFNDDAGTIYCCQRDWSRRGTVIERNIIHMTGKQPRATHTEAIYLDDYSSGVTVRGNIINRASYGVHIGGGQDCDVCGNVIMNCGAAILLGSRGIETFARGISGKGRESDMFKRLERNRALFEGPLWKARYPNMMRVFDFPDAQHAHDAHFNRITNNVCVTSGPISKGNWKHVSATCVVTNNLEIGQDPGFEDYARFGWELKGGRARDMVGTLRLAEIGLYESPRRVSPAVKFAADVTPPRPLRYEYGLATVRVDLPLMGKELPDGVSQVATQIHRCDIPAWGRGMRIVAYFGQAPDAWREYSFSFTPAFDATLSVTTMGARGEKTLYDDFRVEGAELKNGGFESPQGWGLPRPNMNDYRAPICNLEKPFGIITAAEAGVPAAEGGKMACGNDMLNFFQRIDVKKGVPVTISFKARALPVGN